jgi:hypothetical protein
MESLRRRRKRLRNVETTPSYWLFFVVLFVVAFGMNWLWEMLQMQAYAEMEGRSWQETALLCATASIGDALATLGIYGVGALAPWNLRWGMTGR